MPTHVRHDEKELPTLGVEVSTNGAEETATGPLVPSIALPSPSNKLRGTRRLGLRANLSRWEETRRDDPHVSLFRKGELDCERL